MITESEPVVNPASVLVLQLEREAPGDTGVWLALTPGMNLPRLVDGNGAEFPFASTLHTFPSQLARFHRDRIVRWTNSVIDWLEGASSRDSDATFGLTLALRAMGRIVGVPVDIILTNGCPYDVNLQQIRDLMTPPRRVSRLAAEYGIEVTR